MTASSTVPYPSLSQMGSKSGGSKHGAKSAAMLVAIGAFKLVKAMALVAIGVAILMKGSGLGDWIHDVVDALKVDPGNKLVNGAVAKIAGVNAHTLRHIAFGTFVYAALFIAEGVGLLSRKRWGEILTIAITGSFMPIEIYELVEKFTVVRLAALLVNAAIVAYLVWRVRAEKG